MESPVYRDLGRSAIDPAAVVAEAQRIVEEAVGQARQHGMNQLESQKDRVAGTAAAVVNALRETEGQLRQANEARVVESIDRAADKIGQLSRNRREPGVAQALTRAWEFARQRPVLLLGALLLGLVVVRFRWGSRSQESVTSGPKAIVPESERSAPWTPSEEQRTGDAREQIKQKMNEAARDVLDKVQDVADEVQATASDMKGIETSSATTPEPGAIRS